MMDPISEMNHLMVIDQIIQKVDQIQGWVYVIVRNKRMFHNFKSIFDQMGRLRVRKKTQKDIDEISSSTAIGYAIDFGGISLINAKAYPRSRSRYMFLIDLTETQKQKWVPNPNLYECHFINGLNV